MDCIARLIDTDNGLISREIFVNHELYQRELEQIFARGWLFVGHESVIPKKGDFFTSRMGEESVILCRDKKNEIHVFLNTCRHRGMKVCQYDHGNTDLFTCPYHAWSYTTEGKLQGVPMYRSIYDGTLDKSQWSLIEVPRLVNYKGTIWASWDPNAPDFLDYLGDAKEHLDLCLDHRDGSEGGSEMFCGVTKWIIPANWKLGAENFMGDTYHNVSHRSVDLVGIGPSARSDVKGRRDNELAKAKHLWISYPQGHGVHSAIMPANQDYVESFKDCKAADDYFRACYEKRKQRLGDKSRLRPFVGTIFPNTSFHGNQPRSIFMWHPHSPTETEVWRFFLVDADAPEEVKDFLRHYYMRYSGPAGMTEQDDMKNWTHATSASTGTIARRYPYNYQQSLNEPWLNDLLPGNVGMQVSEANPRAFYRRWLTYMEGREWDDLLGRADPYFNHKD